MKVELELLRRRHAAAVKAGRRDLAAARRDLESLETSPAERLFRSRRPPIGLQSRP